MVQEGQLRKPYPSELTDEQWAIVGPMLPPAKQHTPGGRPRKVDMQAVLQTLFSLNRSSCQGDRLPHDGRPKRTVDAFFSPWRDDGTWATLVKALRERTRVAAGRAPTPRAAYSESQAVKTTERGGPERGEDGGQHINGRKRHLWVATLGLLLAVLMTSAGLAEGVAAPILLGHVTPHDLPRLTMLVADQQEPHHALDAWRAEHRAGWRLAVPGRPAGPPGFTPLEQRGVMERTHAWHGRYRRPSKDYERRVASSAAMMQISHMHLILNRLSPCSRPAFHYRKDAA